MLLSEPNNNSAKKIRGNRQKETRTVTWNSMLPLLIDKKLCTKSKKSKFSSPRPKRLRMCFPRYSYPKRCQRIKKSALNLTCPSSRNAPRIGRSQQSTTTRCLLATLIPCSTTRRQASPLAPSWFRVRRVVSETKILSESRMISSARSKIVLWCSSSRSTKDQQNWRTFMT